MKKILLWVKVLKNKYKIPSNPRIWKKDKGGSHIWRGIRDAKDILSEAIKWTVGSGKTTSLWKDWWCGNNSFHTRWGHNSNLPDNTMVEEIINGDGTWDSSKAANFIPPMGVNDMLSTPLPISSLIEKRDIPSWGLSGNGKFSIGSCYLHILNREGIITSLDPNWKWLWKLKLPMRIIQFLWLVKLDRILSNQMCVRRGISNNSSCKHCGLEESANHIFRTCTRA